MPFLADFWLWKQGGGSIPSSLGYAIVAQGNSAASYKFDLGTAAVTASSNFPIVDQGGTACGNSTIGVFWNNNVSTATSEVVTWTTQAYTSLSSGVGNGANTWGVSAGNATQAIMAIYTPLQSTSINGRQLTFSTQTYGSTFTASNFPVIFSFQGIGSTTKGYFYTLSYNFSSSVVTSNDGPPFPVAPGTFPYQDFWQTGAASNHSQALTQYMRTFSDVSFRSQLWTFSTATAATGPTFAAVFPPETSTIGQQAQSNAVSGTSEAVFFEMYNGSSSNLSATEIYIWSSAAVVSSTAIPNLYSGTPSVRFLTGIYHPVSANSIPGYV